MNKDLFGNTLLQKKILDRELLAISLYNILNEITIKEFVNLLTNEFNEIIEYYKLGNDLKACQKTSLLFNPHRLNVIAGKSKQGLFDAMKDKRWLRGLARVVVLNQAKVKEILYQSMQMGVNGVQYVNEFPPHIARDIYTKFGMNTNSKVLDPCSGWGGRMIGSSVIVNSYTGYEPATETHRGLLKLLEFIQKVNPDFQAYVHNIPYEESIPMYDCFDIALTSPPYYDTEQYCDEETNSFNKFKTYRAWCEGFYLPMIDKTMTALKSDSVFILNIGSRKYDLNRVLVENFKQRFDITKLNNMLSNSTGLNKSGEGETFYCVHK